MDHLSHGSGLRHYPDASRNRRTDQRGAVLVVGLLVLLVMTLIGVTGVQVTSLEEKMAGNTRDRNLAFQAAESALRAAEATLATATPPSIVCPDIGATNSPGYFLARDADCDGNQDTDANGNPIQVWDNIDWSEKAVEYDAEELADLAESPRYIIEQLPPSCDSATVPCPAPDQWTPYRITARAVGGTSSAVVMLQSIFRIN